MITVNDFPVLFLVNVPGEPSRLFLLPLTLPLAEDSLTFVCPAVPLSLVKNFISGVWLGMKSGRYECLKALFKRGACLQMLASHHSINIAI